MSDDGGFISVSLVRWMLNQIEKETDISEMRDDITRKKRMMVGERQENRMVGVKVVERLERIDTLCEGFHKRIDGERAMLGDVVKWLNEEAKE